jgi:c-di-GMP-specific phosphodiesterase
MVNKPLVELQHRAEPLQLAGSTQLAEAERLAELGSWTWEVDADVVHWSAGMGRIMGFDPVDGPVPLAGYRAAVHPDDLAGLDAAIVQLFRTGEPYDHEFRIIWPGGCVRWLHARASITRRVGDRATHVSGYAQDVTVRRQAQDELAHHQEILHRIARGDPLSATLEALCRDVEARTPDTHCSVLLVDNASQRLRHAAAPSLAPAYTTAIDGLPVALGMGACGTAAALREPVVIDDIHTDVRGAAFREVCDANELRSVWSHPLLDQAGDVLGTFAVYRDSPHRPDQTERDKVAAAGSLASLAIERSLAEDALTAAAQVDALTGLPNRSHFLTHLTRCLAEPYPGSSLAVMFLDLDRFKWINDSLGHPTGDLILVEAARRLRKVLRGQDVLARFGGDEFTILVQDAHPAAVEQVANRVKEVFAEPVELDGGEFFLTVSVGVALAAPGSAAFDLVRDADAAMYAAKEAGRSRWVLFDDGLRRRAVARVTLESELRRALERDELVLHYQPLRDMSTDQWAGIEALARWEHPTRGVISPDEFIPLAEETGLIVPLGLKLIDQAVAQAAAWSELGINAPVGVNLSVVQLDDPDLPGEVAAILQRHSLPPGRLVIEITESGVMERFTTAHAALDRLAELGLEVVIDDFGTGYSSIARLREMPVTGVKIDRRFTQGLGEDRGVDEVLAAIAGLAHALELEVIAEGIETRVALERAAELGCDLCQGYHLARPAPAAQIEQILRA